MAVCRNVQVFCGRFCRHILVVMRQEYDKTAYDKGIPNNFCRLVKHNHRRKAAKYIVLYAREVMNYFGSNRFKTLNT